MATRIVEIVPRDSERRPSESGQGCGLRMRAAPNGFTLIELMVVVAILGTLMALLFPVFAKSFQSRKILMAHAEVKAIHRAMDLYHEALGEYPPDTEDFGTGANQEITPPDKYMICRYLAAIIQDTTTKKTYGPFFIIDPNHPERIKQDGDDQIYLDPWGNPYHVDAVHAVVDQTTGVVKIYGEPYDGSTEDDQKVETVKVWSDGPDGEYDLGSKVIGPGKGPRDRDQDNITSWAD